MSKAILQVQNCYTRLTTDTDSIKSNLWTLLRFRERGYFHSTLYKQRKWDGYVDFFGRDSGRFLTGLLPEVELALQHWKVDYNLTDEREQIEFVYPPTIDTHFLDPWIPKDEPDFKEMHDYQPEFTNQIIKYHRGVICAPTSAGKTAIMIAILKTLPPKTPTLILANRKSLVQQNYEELIKWGFDNVGRLYDKYKSPEVFTCATVQSLHKIKSLLPHIRALIVDEIHEMMTPTAKKYYKMMKACSVRVAVSATPFKYGGKHDTQKYGVKGYFGPIMKVQSAGKGGILTTEGLQNRGILSGSKCIFYPVHEPQIPYEIYLDAVTKGIAENWGFHEMVTRLAKLQKGRTLILVERLSHGDYLADLLPGALWVRGQDNIDTRKHVIDILQKAKGDIIGIATIGIFNAGINVFVNNLLNCAGGQAEHQIIQRMGRGLRMAKGKNILNYYDFVFHINDYLLEHSKKRIKILKKEGHNVTVKKEIDF